MTRKRKEPKGRVSLSMGFGNWFAERDLPKSFVADLIALAKKERVHGPGTFCYQPLSVFSPEGALDVVVILWDKEWRRGELHHKPGDVQEFPASDLEILLARSIK